MHKFYVSLRAVLILATAIVGQAVGYASATVEFLPEQPISVTGAGRVYVADIDGDGHQDVVVVTTTGITFLYGDGTGAFTAAVYATPISNLSGYVAFGDFNHDGKLDIACTIGDQVDVILNTGSRTFAPPVSYDVAPGANGIAVGDFNGDGKLDIAVAGPGNNSSSGKLGVIINNGDGTFGAPTYYDVGPNGFVSPGVYPKEVVALDINGDGKLDLVVSKHYDASANIYYGDGHGGFAFHGFVQVSGGSLCAADLNNDGIPDLAGDDYWGGAVYYALSDGIGNFPTMGHQYAVGYPRHIEAADFDGDGFKDLVVGCGARNVFDIFINNGDGTIKLGQQFTTSGADVSNAAIGDFNEDGQPDVAVDGWADHISIFLNNTNPAPGITTLSPANIPAKSAAFTLTVTGHGLLSRSVVKWNGATLPTTFANGILTAAVTADLVATPGSVSITVFTGLPGGGTSNTLTFTINGSNGSDFNGDGKADLILQSTSSNKAAIWYMNGATVTGGGYVSSTPPVGWRVAGAGDFNGDNKPDLVLQNSTDNKVAIWYMNGATLTSGGYVSATPASGWLVVGVGDLNGDGKPDIVLQNTGSNKIAFWYMNGATLTGGAYASSTPAMDWKVAGIADFNGDNKPDLVLQNSATNQAAIWYMNGTTLTSGAYTSVTPPAGWQVVSVADRNGDGKPDLILQNTASSQIALWYMNGATLTGSAYASTMPAVEWKVAGPR